MGLRLLGGPSFGQLWFILYLFILSAAALPLLLWLRGDRGAQVCSWCSGRLARPVWWLLPPVLFLVAGALPDLSGHNPFVFLVWFVLGYLMVATDGPVALAERTRWWTSERAARSAARSC